MPDQDGGPLRPLHLVPRRTVIQAGAVTAGGMALGMAVHSEPSAWARSPNVQLLNQSGIATPGATPGGTPAPGEYRPTVLTADEYQTLLAAIDRLIPSDEFGPGASESGVGTFLDSALGNAHSPYVRDYQNGLAALDAASDGGAFVALAEAGQDDILGRAEAGELDDMPTGFFQLLLEHTRQGYFGDPIYGGNRDFAGWDLISYPGVKLVWSPEEQALDTDVALEHRSVADFGATPYTGS